MPRKGEKRMKLNQTNVFFLFLFCNDLTRVSCGKVRSSVSSPLPSLFVPDQQQHERPEAALEDQEGAGELGLGGGGGRHLGSRGGGDLNQTVNYVLFEIMNLNAPQKFLF